MKTDNELIAKFMANDAVNSPHLKAEHELKYHSSWDWLMPVVEKIGVMYNKDFPPNEQFIQMILDKENLPIEEHLKVIALPLGTPMPEAYQSVVEFIKWYNQANDQGQ